MTQNQLYLAFSHILCIIGIGFSAAWLVESGLWFLAVLVLGVWAMLNALVSMAWQSKIYREGEKL